ncbi:response regulator transcription factor [Pseudonocardia kongjuensis]|uniref:Response regulator transcription factor n=1 Tax=Pseudonocardia kongjuensis TaxID=102227 RepID=A0ABN1Y5G4_9PSEU
MGPGRVLVVEDDDGVADAVGGALQLNGFRVQRVRTVADGYDAVRRQDPDLVLLDRRLPDGDGIGLIRSIRELTDAPVILVTARGEQALRVQGLEAGADDYVVKPFGMQELLARVRAVLRRSGRSTARSAPAGPVYLHPETGAPRSPAVLHPGQRRLVPSTPRGDPGAAAEQLSCKEFDLLSLLIRAAGRVVERETIAEQVWGSSWVGDSRTLDVHVSALRGKLGDRSMVRTVRGVGYRLAARVEGP